MDTKDPRFQSAYNDLVGAFFRFINVVNPAPSRQEQIELICNSMMALVQMIEAKPVSPTGNPVSEPHTYDLPDKETGSSGTTGAPEPEPAPETAYTDKRYAIQPTLTAEEIYKFMLKGLKKAEVFDPEKNPDAPDMAEYPFVLEFTGEEGIFTLNPEGSSRQIVSGMFDSQVVELEDGITVDNVSVKSPGKITKSAGGWEVISPLRLSKK